MKDPAKYSLKPVLAASILVLGLALGPGKALAIISLGGEYATGGDCTTALANCEAGCAAEFPGSPPSPSQTWCLGSCGEVYQECLWNAYEQGLTTTALNYDWSMGYVASGTLVTSTSPGIIFDSQTVTTFAVMQSSTFSALRPGPGSYILQTNALGVVQPLHIGLGAWNGSNYVASTTVSNVELYAIPLSVLAAFSPTNYAQAPWQDLGQPIQDTNSGIWNLSWTPTNYTASMVVANLQDGRNTNKNGIYAIASLVIPQPAKTVISPPTVVVPGHYQFETYGPVGKQTTLQASTDLHVWTNLLSFTNSTGNAQFLVSPANTNKAGFYRIVSQ